MTSREGISLLSYGLLVLTITHMLTHVFNQIHIALFPIIRNEFNLSLTQLGLIAAIPPLCQVLISIPSGLITDRVGSKKMIMVSLIIALCSSIIAGKTLNPIMLTIAVSLAYMNTTIYHSSSYTFITKLFKKRDIVKAIGIQDIGGNFGTAMGPISVSIMVGLLSLGWRQVYLFWSMPILLGLFGILNMQARPVDEINKQAPTKTKPVMKESMFTISLALFLIFLAICKLATQMVSTFLPIYLVDNRGLNETLSSLIYGSGALMGIVGAPIGGFFASNFGEKKWLFIVLSLACVSLGLAIIIPNIVAFIVLYLFYGFNNTLAMSARSALMAKISPNRRRGLGYSLYFLPGSIMGVVAPLITAYIAKFFGLSLVFIIAPIIYALGILVLNFIKI